jgi:LPS O-antigen subunit length determinant protein (WzzB/FepE family)
MLIKQLLSIQPAQKNVREQYEDSADFDADMSKIIKNLEEALKIANSSNFKKHMHDTDTNFLTDANSLAKEMTDDISAALKSAKHLYDHIIDVAK